jgi:hypothetical protein
MILYPEVWNGGNTYLSLNGLCNKIPNDIPHKVLAIYHDPGMFIW